MTIFMVKEHQTLRKRIEGGENLSSRIKMIEFEEAEGRLKELYQKFNGKMANILKVHSLNPRSLEAHLEYYKVIMFGRSPLKRATRESIATVVSATNNCHY